MDRDTTPTIRIHQAGELFPLGMVVVTCGVRDTLTPEEITIAIRRHARGDWGALCREDREENERGLREGRRLFSAYEREDGRRRFYVITEADRSVTTVLLPEEY